MVEFVWSFFFGESVLKQIYIHYDLGYLFQDTCTISMSAVFTEGFSVDQCINWFPLS